MTQERIFIVEDDRNISQLLVLMLGRLGHMVVGMASSGEDAVTGVGETRPDLVLMDIGLEGEMDGIEAGSLIHQVYNIPVLFLTGCLDCETRARARSACPAGYLTKPFTFNELSGTIEKACRPSPSRPAGITEQAGGMHSLPAAGLPPSGLL